MGTLTRDEITSRIVNESLLINAKTNSSNEYEVEISSYDLSVGIAVIKHNGENIFSKRIKQYVYQPEKLCQDTVTLKPGQMMFVITHEEIKMPNDLSATVYSRNSLALDGVLALNAGHVDPGYEGPITIKLINLRNTNYTLTLGESVFTIVFSKLDTPLVDYKGQKYTKAQFLKKVLRATDISLDNALYDLALLNNFVKKDEFGKSFFSWLTRKFWGIIVLLFSILGFFVTTFKILESIGLTELIPTLKDDKVIEERRNDNSQNLDNVENLNSDTQVGVKEMMVK